MKFIKLSEVSFDYLDTGKDWNIQVVHGESVYINPDKISSMKKYPDRNATLVILDRGNFSVSESIEEILSAPRIYGK